MYLGARALAAFSEPAEGPLLAVPRGAMEPAGYNCSGRVHRSDLLEDRHQIEVVAETLILPSSISITSHCLTRMLDAKNSAPCSLIRLTVH